MLNKLIDHYYFKSGKIPFRFRVSGSQYVENRTRMTNPGKRVEYIKINTRLSTFDPVELEFVLTFTENLNLLLLFVEGSKHVPVHNVCFI